MNLKLIRYDEVPPGGFRYKDPETGQWVRGPNWNEIRVRVRKHRQANNLPIPVDLDERIEQQLCEILPPEFCRGNHSHAAPLQPLTLKQILQGTATLVDWGFHGGQAVASEESARRAKICFHCHFNQDTGGCTTCSRNDIRNAAKAIIGGNRTPYDSHLHICSICGCALRVKVHVPLDILQRHFTEEQNANLPDYCWVKKT